MLTTRSRRFIVLLAIFCEAFVSSAAWGQSCNLSIADLSFGAIDVTANAPANASTQISITCASLVSVALRVCVNIGPGVPPASNASTRYMASGSNNLTYGLFSDSGATSPVGSNFWPAGGGNPIIVDFPLLIGTDTKTANLYGRVYSGQQTAPAGAYSTSFGTSDAVIQYGLLSLISCDLLTARDRTTFTASASVSTNCSVTASNLNFGSLGVLNAAVDGSTTISPVCTNGAPYTIGLNGGLSSAVDPTQRKMSKASEFILYGLYRDAARTQPFGDTAGVNTVSGTGSGVTQSVPVYGRIPPQSTPSSGAYSDTIVVTLTF